MAINFEDARVLSYNRVNRFFGEAFRYGSQKELTFEGKIYALDNPSGVIPVWSGISGMVAGATDYDAIMVLGQNLGSGRINSLSFKEDIDVRFKEYTCNVTVYDTGNLFNLTGIYYSGLNLTNVNHPIHLVNNFNENYNFEIKEDGTYSYKQDITVQFISGKVAPNSLSAIQMARNLASGLLSSSVPFGFLDPAHSGFYNVPGKRTYVEHYNLMTNECSFSENFEVDTPSGNYSIKYSHVLNTNQDGTTTAQEQGRIKGLFPDYYANAESGFAAQSLEFFTRSSGVCDYYLGGIGYPLRNQHTTFEKRVNKLVGEIEYNITYSNNPEFNPNYAWAYTQEIELDDTSCFYKVKEAGRVRGLGNCDNTLRNTHLNTAWNSIKTGISTRVSGFYNDVTNLSNSMKPVATQLRGNAYNAEINYDYTFTDDLFYHVLPNIKRIDFSIENDFPVIKANKFDILNVKELVQRTPISTEGHYTFHLNLVGERGTSFNTCYQAAKNIASGQTPPYQRQFISRAETSFSPKESILNMNVEWTYIFNIQ